MRNILVGKQTRQWIQSAFFILIVVGLFSLAAPSAKADTWSFSLTDPGHTTNIDFSFDTTATSTAFSNYFQLDSPVDWTLNGVDQGAETLSFWNASAGGGLLYGSTPQNDNGILNLWGPQLYSGPESAPTFLEGTYSFNSCCGAQFDSPFTLTLVDPVATPEPTPEPSSVLLLGTGLLGMIGLAGYQVRRGRLEGAQL